MDNNIRTLLAVAQKCSEKDLDQALPALQQAYKLMRNVTETRATVDNPESFSHDLYVLCAELAFQLGLANMANECLKMYFMKTPPANQFLCRAYLCQSQLLAPDSANHPDQLDRAVVYLLKAISFAKENPRYHFLVYNASVLYWQFCRPFLKPNSRQYLARSLHQVVKALDDIDDQDFEWRAQLMIHLIDCHLDAGKKSDAAYMGTAAAVFIRQHVPHLYKQVFGMLVRHQLIDSHKLHKDIKSHPELSIYYRICKLKVAIEKKEVGLDVHSELVNIVKLVKRGAEKEQKPPSTADRSKKRTTTPATSLPDEASSRSTPTKQRRTPTPTGKKLPPDHPGKPYLLLETARVALEHDEVDIAEQCVDLMKTSVIKDPSFFIEIEILQCEMMVRALGLKQESYQKHAVDVTLAAIKRCNDAIHNAVRSGNPSVIQVGCVTQWNLCLPLLQNNLRKHVRRPLTLVADALEGIQSLLVLLRCQVHTELAKCEEDEEQIDVAMEHLKKALGLDDSGVYRERLEVSLTRLQLRAQLYKQADRPEDQAAMIIEQARKSNSGTIRMKRSLLVGAGQALSPDAFLLVLDSESDTKEATSGKGPLSQISKLAGKAKQFNKCVTKAEGHLKRLGDENDKERARLWADLAKTARKQEVWDVCRVAARFCLLYDDNRWKNQTTKPDTPKPDKAKMSMTSMDAEATKSATDIGEGAVPDRPDAQTSAGPSRKKKEPTPLLPEIDVPLYEKDLIRMLAEVHFIYGEGMVHLLRSEGVELNDMPNPPKDTSKRPKGYVAKKPEEDPDWQEYCEWIKSLTDTATNAFLRAAELGEELKEPWIVCSAATYVWNYNNHILSQNRHREIVDPLTVLLEKLKTVGHAGETTLLVNVCNAVATGLMNPWIPPPPPKDAIQPSLPDSASNKSPRSAKSPKKSRSQTVAPVKSKTVVQVTINPDATPDLKQALEVCEYVIEVTGGKNPQDVVPIAIRHPLLQTWVKVTQMLQQPIKSSLGTDDENDNEGQKPMTRAMVAVEMHSLSSNGIMEFKEGPNVPESIQLVEKSTWTDKLIELQLWARLAYLALENKDHTNVVKCSNQALAFDGTGTQSKGRKTDSHKLMVEQEMLSYAACILGQSLVENWQGKNTIRRQALEAFMNAARFGYNANNQAMVVTAARHYWNTCLPLVNSPLEREILKEPLRLILKYMAETSKQLDKQREKEEREKVQAAAESAASGEPFDPSESQNLAPQGSTAVDTTPADATDTNKTSAGIIGDPEDDLTLRAAMYGVLFQSFADRGEWEEGLKAMDQAIADMPRTNHRLLLFKHMVVVNAKLGRNVNTSIAKFKDSSEDYVAYMWRRVALCSKEKINQLQAYQFAIAALTLPSSDWQKFDYLLEFGQWLYCNEFPLTDALDQLEWAVDILLNMKIEQPKEKGKGKRGKKDSKDQTSPKKDKGKEKKDGKKGKGGGGKVKDGKKEEQEQKEKEKKAESSADEGDINAADYVPVEKEIVIGLAPANPNLTMRDVNDIRQLEGLFRAHVLLAQVAGRHANNCTDYVIMAYIYLMKLFHVAMSSAGPVCKELAKNPPSDLGADGKFSSKSKPKKDKDKVPVKEKPKRKGPPEALPKDSEDWSVYDAPDEVIDAFRQSSMKLTGINKNTIHKPILTFSYMESLVRLLQDLGYNHMALPVLALADLFSRDLLKHRALNSLVHLKSMEVCIELNLPLGVSFHQKLANVTLDPDEQAICREEIVMWKDRQIQVAKEEVRIKQSLARLVEAGKRKQMRLATSDTQQGEEGKDEPAYNHLGKQIGAVTMKDVWTDTAALLISQGMYQPARELLNEAILTVKAMKDRTLEAEILYQLGRLSYLEAQYGQAVNFCDQAQQTHEGDEMFWYKTTILIADSYLKDVTLRDGKRKARFLLLCTLNTYKQLQDGRPNKESIVGYCLSMMEARLASIQIDIITSEHQDWRKPRVINGLVAACKKYQHASDRFVQTGHQREAVQVMKKHGAIYWKLAKLEFSVEEKHGFYLKALSVFREAVSVSEAVLHDVQTLSTLQEVRNFSLPVQREAAYIKMEYSELMLDMFQQHIEEERNKQLQEQRKGSVLRMVESLIRETPNLSDSEKDWKQSSKVLADRALAQLTNAHSLTGQIPRLKAKAMYLLGRCLHLLGVHQSPDPPRQWEVQQMDLRMQLDGLESIADLAATAADHKDEEEKDELDINSRDFAKYSPQITKLQTDVSLSHHYISQATECLAQAVNLALQQGCVEVVSAASQELVECFGQFDSSAASQYMALHQSCEASVYLNGLIQRALYDPTTAQLSALLHQRRHLLEGDVTTNQSIGPVMASITETLDRTSAGGAPSLFSFQAWKRLSISQNHLDLLKDFPPNFNIFLLQHSPDRKYLYGAVLDKPKPAHDGGGSKSKKATSLQGLSRAKVVRVKTSPKALDELVQKALDHKHDVQLTLLKQEYQRTQEIQRQKMLANLEGDKGERPKSSASVAPSMSASNVGEEEEVNQDVEDLEEEFAALVAAMEQYLQPITQDFDMAVRPTSSVTVSNSKEVKEPLAPAEYVILLADQHLMELPLEAIQTLQNEAIVSLTRDVSLQMLNHRIHQGNTEQADMEKKAKEKGYKLPSRIPGLRDANKKQSKIIPLERTVPSGCIPVETHNFRFFVDPNLDCPETEKRNPIEVMKTMMEFHSQQFTPRWLGVMGDEHIPSVGEYEVYANESSALIFYGMGRFLCYLPPDKVAALNLPDCNIVMLLDLAETSNSFRRQSKIDVLKSADTLTLEKPVESAMLLGLTGVRCVMANQWHCTLAENAGRLEIAMKDLLEKGKTTGETVRLLFTPYRQPTEEEEQEMDANADAESKAGSTKPAKSAEVKGQKVKEEKHEVKGESSENKSEADEAEEDEEEEKEEVRPTRNWYNMVCYGLPNLMVTQIEKYK